MIRGGGDVARAARTMGLCALLWGAAWTVGLCALLCAQGCSHAEAEPQGKGRASGAATGAPAASASPASAPASPAESWGVEAVSLRPALGGTMLDFRYRVIDAEKARPLFDRKIKPYLFDPSTGVALGMPEDTKLGALRSSPRNPPVAGKQYFILFANGQGTVKRHSRVSVAIGDCKLEGVIVE